MAFTKVLYYPWIDIKDENWLKNALLYWDSVQTIVPFSIQKPYQSDTAKEFNSEGLLTPLNVNRKLVNYIDIRDKVLSYIYSPEGIAVLRDKSIKFGKDQEHEISIHMDKMSREVIYLLESMGFEPSGNEWFNLPGNFAGFYLTTLAVRLAENAGIGLISDNSIYGKLTESMRLDNGARISGIELITRKKMNRRSLPSFSECILADLVINLVRIAPDTPVKDIIKFRKKHSDEIGLFRTEIAELTNKISKEQSIDAIRQNVHDIYTNKVVPSINNLKKALKDTNIVWATGNLVKMAVFSVPSSCFLTEIGLSIPSALLIGAGASVVASAVLYNRDKARLLRENPYSYVLSLESNFTK